MTNHSSVEPPPKPAGKREPAQKKQKKYAGEDLSVWDEAKKIYALNRKGIQICGLFKWETTEYLPQKSESPMQFVPWTTSGGSVPGDQAQEGLTRYPGFKASRKS